MFNSRNNTTSSGRPTMSSLQSMPLSQFNAAMNNTSSFNMNQPRLTFSSHVGHAPPVRVQPTFNPAFVQPIHKPSNNVVSQQISLTTDTSSYPTIQSTMPHGTPTMSSLQSMPLSQFYRAMNNNTPLQTPSSATTCFSSSIIPNTCMPVNHAQAAMASTQAQTRAIHARLAFARKQDEDQAARAVKTPVTQVAQPAAARVREEQQVAARAQQTTTTVQPTAAITVPVPTVMQPNLNVDNTTNRSATVINNNGRVVVNISGRNIAVDFDGVLTVEALNAALTLAAVPQTTRVQPTAAITVPVPTVMQPNLNVDNTTNRSATVINNNGRVVVNISGRNIAVDFDGVLTVEALNAALTLAAVPQTTRVQPTAAITVPVPTVMQPNLNVNNTTNRSATVINNNSRVVVNISGGNIAVDFDGVLTAEALNATLTLAAVPQTTVPEVTSTRATETVSSAIIPSIITQPVSLLPPIHQVERLIVAEQPPQSNTSTSEVIPALGLAACPVQVSVVPTVQTPTIQLSTPVVTALVVISSESLQTVQEPTTNIAVTEQSQLVVTSAVSPIAVSSSAQPIETTPPITTSGSLNTPVLNLNSNTDSSDTNSDNYDSDSDRQQTSEDEQLTDQQTLQNITLQNKQVDLINRIQEKLTLFANEQAQLHGDVINVKEKMDTVTAKITILDYDQIKKFNEALDQAESSQNTVGQFEAMPAAFPLAIPILWGLGASFVTYLFGKAVVETYEIVQQSNTSTDPLGFSVHTTPADRVDPTPTAPEFPIEGSVSSSSGIPVANSLPQSEGLPIVEQNRSLLTLFNKTTEDNNKKQSDSDSNRNSGKGPEGNDNNRFNGPESSGLNRYGGGKDAKHAGQGAREAARKKLAESKSELTRLEKLQNPKTPELKEQIKKIEKAIRHWKEKLDNTGENHSQKHKGNR